jgi:hypothetical protein
MRANVTTLAITLALCITRMLNPAAAEQSTSNPRGATYATIATLPDWSGVWVIPFEAFAQENARENAPGRLTGPPLTQEQVVLRDATRESTRQRLLSGEGQRNRCAVP